MALNFTQTNILTFWDYFIYFFEITYLAQYPLLFCIDSMLLETSLVMILQSCFQININNNDIFIKYFGLLVPLWQRQRTLYPLPELCQHTSAHQPRNQCFFQDVDFLPAKRKQKWHMYSNKIMVKFTKLGTKMASWCGFKTLQSLSNGNGNGSRLAKQQLCTLFSTFLCCHCTTTMWKCLNLLFVKDGNKRQ